MIKYKRTKPYIDFCLDTLINYKTKNYSKLKNYIKTECIKNPNILKILTNVKLCDLKEVKKFEKKLLELDKYKENDIKLYIALFSHFKEELKSYLNHKFELEKMILIGAYEEALNKIEEIEKDIGFSLWLIENKVNLLDLAKGIKIQKEYIKGVVENEEIGFIIRYILYHYSHKLQSKTIIEHEAFLKYFFNDLKNYDFLDYIKYKFDYTNEYKNLNNENLILRTESKISIYDGYEALIKIIQKMLIKDKLNKNLENIFMIFINEFEDLNDHRVQKIKENIEKKIINFDKKNIEITNLYEKGSYNLCYEKCKEELHKNPLKLELYDIYINSTIMLNKDIEYDTKSIMYVVLNLIRDLKLLKKDFKEIQEEINRNLRKFSINTWSIGLLYINEFIMNGYNINKDIIALYQMNSKFYDLKNLKKYDDDLYEQIKNENEDVLIFNLLENFYKYKFKEIEKLEIPIERKIRYIAEGHYEKQEYNEVIKLIEKHYKNNEITFNLVLNSYILSYLKLGNVEKAIQIIVKKYLKNKNTSIYLPINEIIETTDLFKLKGSIDLPIIYNIYSKVNNNNKNNFKEYEEYEDFLMFYKKEKATDLLEDFKNEKIDTEKLNYFLENVCSLQNMELSIFFSSKLEIIDERIKICNYLIEKNNNSKLIDEIFSLNKQKLITEGMEQLNDGKINLNTEELKKVIIEQLEIHFQVCKLNDELGINIEDEIFEPLKLFEDENNENKVESTNLLHRLIYEARNIFILNEKFGLDTCLSTQIRHGIIVNAMRNIFEEFYLVTKKDKYGNYLENIYWIELLNIEEKYEERKELANILNNTSKKIDDLALKVKNEFIQIVTEQIKTKENGLFDYHLYYQDMNDWCKKIKTMETIEEFANFIMNIFLVLTQENLDRVQKHLKTVETEFIDILNDCLTNVINLNKFEVTEFRNKISYARQSIQSEMSKIIKWFNISKKNNISEYDGEFLKELLMTSIKCKLNVKDELNYKFKGETLNGIFHILYNLILNSINHSGKENTECNLYFKEDEKNIKISVKNEVFIDYEEIDKKISEVKEKLEQKSDIKLNNEGGTGFKKIKNILDNILKVKNKILVTRENSNFIVEIILDKKGVLI